MRNDWIRELLEDKASNRPIVLKGVRGQDQEIENLICGESGREIAGITDESY